MIQVAKSNKLLESKWILNFTTYFKKKEKNYLKTSDAKYFRFLVLKKNPVFLSGRPNLEPKNNAGVSFFENPIICAIW